LTKKRLKMTTSREVRRTINRVANMLLNNEIDPKRANAILYGCNVCLSAIRVDDQQAQIDELEDTLDEVKNGYPY
jgi:predicted Zn-dependent peptidase